MASDSSAPRRRVINRLFTFLIVVAGCFLAAALLIAVVEAIAKEKGNPTGTMRLATLVQDVVMFIAPALACAFLFRGKGSAWSWLQLNRLPGGGVTLAALGAWIASIPAMQALVSWNESLSLSAFPTLEAWMRAAETQAAEAIRILMGSPGVGSLIVNLLLVAVLAGLSEELLFRGTLQQVLTRTPGRYQIAVWASAFIFSAIHFQFFGFFPRLLLGVFFGYALVWGGSLWLPIMLHILNNGVIVFLEWQSPGSSDQPIAAIDNPWLIALSVIATALCLLLMFRHRSRP